MKAEIDFDKVIDDVAEKFDYDDEIKKVLKRIVPIMASSKDDEIQQMLVDTLNRTKIFVIDHSPKTSDVEKLQKEVMGKNNKNIKFLDDNSGEYGKMVGEGAYVNEPIFDENINLTGRSSLLYVSKLPKNSKLTEIYGTSLNLSHLIHELGHAWASEKNEFVQKENGDCINNVGACYKTMQVNKENKEVSTTKVEGLFIEEALNSIEEENTLCKLLNIQSIDELKSYGYIKSNYQGFMTNIMREYVQKFGEKRFDEFRYLKDSKALEEINQSIKDTDAWETMQTDEYTINKRKKFSDIEKLNVSDGAKKIINNVVNEYETEYFPDNSKFTPIEKLNNVFTQIYNLGVAKYNFGIIDNEENMEIYKKIMTSIIAEGYVPKNQAKDIGEYKRSEEINSQINFEQDLKSKVNTDENIAKLDENYENDEKNINVEEQSR